MGNPAVVRTAIKDPDNPQWSGRATPIAASPSAGGSESSPGPAHPHRGETHGAGPRPGPIAATEPPGQTLAGRLAQPVATAPGPVNPIDAGAPLAADWSDRPAPSPGPGPGPETLAAPVPSQTVATDPGETIAGSPAPAPVPSQAVASEPSETIAGSPAAPSVPSQTVASEPAETVAGLPATGPIPVPPETVTETMPAAARSEPRRQSRLPRPIRASWRRPRRFQRASRPGRWRIRCSVPNPELMPPIPDLKDLPSEPGSKPGPAQKPASAANLTPAANSGPGSKSARPSPAAPLSGLEPAKGPRAPDLAAKPTNAPSALPELPDLPEKPGAPAPPSSPPERSRLARGDSARA